MSAIISRIFEIMGKYDELWVKTVDNAKGGGYHV